MAVISIFYTGAATFLSSSSSVVLTRLSGPRSRPTTPFFFCSGGNRTRASGSVAKNSLCTWKTCLIMLYQQTKTKQTPWHESMSKLDRLKDRRLSGKLVPTFADRGFHMVSVTDPYRRTCGFLDRSCYFFFHEASQLYS
jgi:hypothetical protein